MITRKPAAWQPTPPDPGRTPVCDGPTLLERLHLNTGEVACLDERALEFPTRVPEAFIRRMRPGDPDDPLLRQVLARPEEAVPAEGYCADPVGDLTAIRSPGLLHKYRGRVLLIATAACVIHCRYCFRRHFPYAEQQLREQDLDAALDYIAADDGISEVILSGGDPLSLSPRRIAGLIERLNRIPHLTRLRFHSRVPVVAPELVTGELLDAIEAARPRPVLVVHANHPREIDAEVARGLADAGQRGITLLNQSVLLRGVNDDAEVLKELSERLFAAGVLPYYLHLLDPVQGAAHFAVPPARARDLLANLRRDLPGYLVPRLVREQAGAPSKLPLDD